MKRFKKSPTDEMSHDLPDDVTKASNAKEIFRKMTQMTQYQRQLGDKPKDKQDFNVLQSKPLLKLQCSQVLKPHIAQLLSKWLTINDQDKFTSRIFYTIREMFTVCKNQLADVPTSQENHAAHVELMATPPRFDRMITGIENGRRAKESKIAQRTFSQRASAIQRFKRSGFEAIDYKIGSKHRDQTPGRLDPKSIYLGPPMIDTKAFKQAFLKGEKDAVLYCDPNEHNASSYQNNLKGMQVRGLAQAQILNHNRTSYVGPTMPDPN